MKTGGIVILVIVIIIAIVFVLRGAGILGEREDPEVWEQTVNVIDVETLDAVEVTTGEWHNQFKTNPETGYKVTDDGRKLAVPIRCPHCQSQIPPAPVPEGSEPEEEEAAMRDYTCPECGETVHPEFQMEQ